MPENETLNPEHETLNPDSSVLCGPTLLCGACAAPAGTCVPSVNIRVW